MHKILRGDCSFYGTDTALVGGELVAAHVLKLLRETWRGWNPDLFVFFFAGHGETLNFEHVLHCDGSSQVRGDHVLKLNQILDAICNELQAKATLLFLDACRSADMKWTPIKVGETTRRIISVPTQSTFGQGRSAVFFGCSFNEVCGEESNTSAPGHGHFSRATLEFLKQPGDAPFTDLVEYVADHTARLSLSHEQKPMVDSDLNRSVFLKRNPPFDENVWRQNVGGPVRELISFDQGGIAWFTHNSMFLRRDAKSTVETQAFPDRYVLAAASHNPSDSFLLALSDDPLIPTHYELWFKGYGEGASPRPIEKTMEGWPLAVARWPDENAVTAVWADSYVVYNLHGGKNRYSQCRPQLTNAAFSRQYLATTPEKTAALHLYKGHGHDKDIRIDPQARITLLRFSPDGSRLGFVDRNCRIVIYDPDLQRMEHELTETHLRTDHWITAWAMSTDCTMIAFATADVNRSILLLNLERGSFSAPRHIASAFHLVTSLLFSHSDRSLYSATSNGVVAEWDLEFLPASRGAYA